MKITICSCARCTAAGSEFLFDAVNLIKSDLRYAYELENLGEVPEIEVVYENIMKDIDDRKKAAPLAKIDDTYYRKAKPEVIMENILKKFAPEDVEIK